jgi:hypothetical protein
MRDASFVPDLDAWEPWRPEEVAARLESMRAPWAIAGGWAIDLYLGEQTRAHKDIEIAIDRDQAATVWACLDDLDWFAIGRGRAWPLADAPPQLHQTWGRDRALRRWRLDVLREPWDGGDWVFRRDSRIRRPLAQAIDRNSDAVPFLAPRRHRRARTMRRISLGSSRCSPEARSNGSPAHFDSFIRRTSGWSVSAAGFESLRLRRPFCRSCRLGRRAGIRVVQPLVSRSDVVTAERADGAAR